MVVRHFNDTGIVNSQLFRGGNSLRIGEIRRIVIAERTQQECRVHLRRARSLWTERGRARAVYQTVFVQILHIRLLPVFQIGKRRGIGQLLCFRLFAEQPNQHGRRFGAGRLTVQVVAQFCALKQSHIVQRIRAVRIISRKCRSGQHGGSSSADTRGAHPFFHKYASSKQFPALDDKITE